MGGHPLSAVLHLRPHWDTHLLSGNVESHIVAFLVNIFESAYVRSRIFRIDPDIFVSRYDLVEFLAANLSIRGDLI